MKLSHSIYTFSLTLLLFVSCNEKPEKEKTIKRTQTETTAVSNPLKESVARGRLVYNDSCITCHMASGEGVANVFPPLANSDYLKNNQLESLKGIKYGQNGKIVVNGKTYNGAMAALGLADDEVADVMNYINNSWGNKYGKLITEEEVAKIEK